MRTIHLFAILCLAAAALVALWLGLCTTSGGVRAQSTSDTSATSSASASLDPQSAAASAAASEGVREAIHVGPSPEELAKAEAERKQRESKLVEGRIVGPD